MGVKHDGSIHRVWDKACKVYEDDEKIMISNAKTLIREYDGRMWMAKEPSLTTYYKHRWFNIIGIIRSEGVHYYCNIASPIIIEDDVIKYIDYDLDFKVDPSYNVKILDEFEYKNHKKIYNYSSDLDEVVKFNFNKVKKMIENKEFPFNHEVVDELYKKYLNKGE